MGLGDILSLIGSVLLIAGVLALTYYASRWYAKRIGTIYGQGKYVSVIDRTPLGQGSAVFVVKAGEKYYLLGSGDKSVSMLAELEGFEELPQPVKNADIPFRQILGGIMEKVKRPENKDSGENQ